MLLDLFARAHDGVPRALLWLLNNEMNACVLHSSADFLCLVADDDVNFFDGNNTPGAFNDVRQQRLAANLVQNFCAFGVKPCTLAGSHDDNREIAARAYGLWGGHEETMINQW